jgi:hypothetical protein
MERSTIFHGKIHERVRFTKYLKHLVGITWEGLGEILERLKLYEGKKNIMKRYEQFGDDEFIS